jgi:hypothetical protein
MSDCVQTVYVSPLLPNNTASQTFLNKQEAVRSICLSLGRRPGGDWANTWYWTKSFKIFSNRSSGGPSYFHIYSLSHSYSKAFVKNTVIILRIHYTDYNIHKLYYYYYYYGRLQYLILLFKTPMGTRKKFFEIYRQFRHAPSREFATLVFYETN